MLLRYVLCLTLPIALLTGCNKKCTQKCDSNSGGLIAVGYTLAELDSTKAYRYPEGTVTNPTIDSLVWSYTNTMHDTLIADQYAISEGFDYMISGPHLSGNYSITDVASGGGDQYSTEYCDDMDNVCNNPPYMNAYTINYQNVTISSRGNSFVYVVK